MLKLIIMNDDHLIIANTRFKSRLLIGTGKYSSPQMMKASIKAAESEIMTVAIRRVDIDEKTDPFLSHIDPKSIIFMPNTSGARTAEEAIRLAQISVKPLLS